MKYSSEDIGKVILKLRKEKDLTQEELGLQLHCSGKQVSLYESGKTTPPIDMLFKMCEIFNCQLGFLLGEPDYSEGTQIETVIRNESGLTKESINEIRVLTGTGKTSPSFGYKSEEYRSLLNKIISSKEFRYFMEAFLDLDEVYTKYKSIMPNLTQQLGNDRFNAAWDLAYEIETSAPEDLDPGLTQAQLDDAFLFQKAEDEQLSMVNTIKFRRYEAREAFEALLSDIYPKTINE